MTAKAVAHNRNDEKTLLCKVDWIGPNKEILKIIVPVACTIDEYSAPIRHGDDFEITDAPVALPEHIEKRAIDAAKSLAKSFIDKA